MDFAGVYSVVPTPFQAGGEVDHESLQRVVDLVVGAGVQGIVVLGILGEAARLTEAERSAVVATVVGRVGGRARVVVGTTAEGERTCIAFSQEAQRLGASAVLVSPPRLAKLNSEAVVHHYAAVSDAVDLPIVVQDYPPSCGYAMEAGLLVRIARQVPAARTIKLEDPPTPFKIARLLAAAGETRITVVGGLGGLFLLEELTVGAAGAMTGFSYPEVLVDVVREYRAGRVDRAAELFYPFVPLMRFECQEGLGLAIRKEIYRRRGVLADASTRAPGAVLDEGTRGQLDRVLAWTARQPGAEWMTG